MKHPQIATDQTAAVLQEEDMEFTEPSPEAEYPDDKPYPAKRTKKDHSPESRTPSTEISLVPSFINDNSAMAGSISSYPSTPTDSMEYLASETSSAAHPRTSNTPFFMPHFRPQLIHESRNVPTTNTENVREEPIGPRPDLSHSSGALVPFNVQPFGLEVLDYNNGQHSIVPRQSSQAVGINVGHRQCFTVTSKYRSGTVNSKSFVGKVFLQIK